MNAIQWMVHPPNPKIWMAPKPAFTADDVKASRVKLQIVLGHVKKSTFVPQEWRIARGFASRDSANREIAMAVKCGLVECIAPAYSGGAHGSKSKARPAVYKAVAYEA